MNLSKERLEELIAMYEGMGRNKPCPWYADQLAALRELLSLRSQNELTIGVSGCAYDHEVDHWLSEQARLGAVVLCEMEGGDIGVFIGDAVKAIGDGDTVFEAVESVIRNSAPPPAAPEEV